MLTLLAAAALQTTWIVDVNATGPGQGTSGDPYVSVTYALQQAATLSGDTVLVLPGVYPDESVDYLGKSLVIRSSGGAAVTELRGSASPQPDGAVVRAVSGEGPGTLLEGFTLVGTVGDAVQSPFNAAGGGAVRCEQITMELRDLVITGGDQVQFGAGVYIRGGAVQMNGVTIEAAGSTVNTPEGGGMYVGDGALVRMVRCSLLGNVASQLGGGLACRNSTVLMSETELNGNSAADGMGGAIYAEGATVRIDDCDITDNLGRFGGGGISAQSGGMMDILGSVLSGNDAGFTSDPYSGGAIEFGGDSLSLIGCELAGNRGQFGGAIATVATTTIEDCILRNNTVAGAGQFSCDGGAIAGGSAMTVRGSLFLGNRAMDTYCSGGAAVRGPVAIDRCTFVDNTAVSGSIGSTLLLGSGTMTNSIVVDGSPSPVDAAAVTYSNVQGGQAGLGNMDDDPRFWDPASDFRLLPSSTSIDAGDPMAAADTDGTRVDMGAYPFDPYVGQDIGTATCAGNVNSTGAGAVLTARGDTDVMLDRVTLHVESAPSGALGYFLTSRMSGMQPLGGGSQGTLCLSGSVLRFSATTLDDRGTSVVSFHPRVGDFPQGNVVLAGESWFFQYWFRDANPLSTSNTSSAVRVDFL